ncbi:MAG: DUF1648 domain-containing protein [Azoarcus sp.]|jgi:uncharacterized membrane protein|nr:DUF1648 domain-containing protein [Azoarcus sp.]
MRIIVLLAIVLAVFFVWITGGSLPPTVASHFDASGTADSFVSRGTYLAVMIVMVILVPLMVAFASRVFPENVLNIPNKSYWLSPERRAGSLAFISLWSQWCSIGVTVFFCYLHWLVVRGNGFTPPQLESIPMYGGSVVALVALTIGIVALVARFRRLA